MKKIFLFLLTGIALNAHAQFSNTGALYVGSAAQMSVTGSFTNNSTATYTNNGDLYLQGDFTNNQTATAIGTGTTTFNGTSAQTINGSATTTFYKAVINNSGSGVTLNRDIAIDAAGDIKLTAGNLFLNLFVMYVKNTATTGIQRTSGKLISEIYDLLGTTPSCVRTYSTVVWSTGSATGTYIVPFGTTATYIPFTANITTGGLGDLTLATYHTNSGNLPLPLSNVSLGDTTYTIGTNASAYAVDRFWYINSSGLAGTANFTFTYDDRATASDDINSLTGGESGSNGTGLRAQRWNAATKRWLRFYSPSQAISTSNNTVTISTVSGSALTTSNAAWTLALQIRPLPIELLEFDVNLKTNKQADITWQTAQEENNKEFVIERSKDGISYSVLTMVNGAGTTHKLNSYATIDAKPYQGVSYYRLKQIDYNGQSTYSKVVTINNAGAESFSNMYPNPAVDVITVLFNEEHNTTAKMKIVDITGRVVYVETVSVSEGSNQLSFDIAALANGMYSLTLESNEGVVLHESKFVKTSN